MLEWGEMCCTYKITTAYFCLLRGREAL